MCGGQAPSALKATAVVNVVLPSIGRDLGAGVAGLQWTLNAYALTLASLVLAAGALSDIYGRRRVFILGVVVFVAASAPRLAPVQLVPAGRSRCPAEGRLPGAYPRPPAARAASNRRGRPPGR